jgi:molybdate-binding protein
LVAKTVVISFYNINTEEYDIFSKRVFCDVEILTLATTKLKYRENEATERKSAKEVYL